MKKITGKHVELVLILVVLALAVYIVYKFANKETFQTKPLPILTVYHTEWCGHSTELLKEKGIWEALKLNFTDKIIFEKVDCDAQTEKCTTAQITALPTIKIGTKVYNGVHPFTEESLIEFINKNTK
jgi:thioredoxin-like negative regulator of GroEL